METRHSLAESSSLMVSLCALYKLETMALSCLSEQVSSREPMTSAALAAL